MTDKRYQVFVSSTFHDLEDERQEVMHALLELDCIPSGMELFPAANEAQWNLIKRVIDDCDYYMLILAGRYGSIGPEGISYTEMEYRYALETGKPTIAFLHRNPGKIIADKSEPTPEGKDKLKIFRELVEKKLCKLWESPSELGSVVSRSLVQLIKSTPAVGWVRANELADREATLELLQLRRRVEELQTELSRVRTSAPKGAEGLSQGEDKYKIMFSFEAVNKSKYTVTTYNNEEEISWNDIFASIAPLMIRESTDISLKKAIDNLVMTRSFRRLKSETRFSNCDFRHFQVFNDYYHTIKVQLRALGLIIQSENARSVKDQHTYWKLTPYGDETMTQLCAIRRGKDNTNEGEI